MKTHRFTSAMLELYGARVTDAGLPNLYRLTHLQQLNLNETQVTEYGVTALRKALPNCKIASKYPGS
jgi:hypothetical protein